MLTRTHVLAMRAACLGLCGVVLLFASVSAAFIEGTPVPLDQDGLISSAAAQSPSTATPIPPAEAAGESGTAVPVESTAVPTMTATPTSAPASTPTATPSGVADGGQFRMPAPLDPGALDSSESLPLAAGPEQARPQPRLEPSPTPEPVDTGTRIFMPYRSQFDGSWHEGGNCGPASLAMILDYYGRGIETHALRESINRRSGDWGRDSGTSWTDLRRAAEAHGLTAYGMTDEHGRMRQWTMDDLLEETRAGRPVIVLAHYRSLPGHETAGWYGDHYVVFLGMTSAGDVIYHDPAFRDGEGENIIISQAQFERAWTNTWIRQNRQAMAVGLP